MSRCLFVHVGLVKTGTTAIQEAMYANVNWFRSNGIVVPSLGLARTSGHLDLARRLADPARAQQTLGELRDDVAGQGMLVSSEHLCTGAEFVQPALAALRELATMLDLEIRVLMWLRRPVGLAQSQLLHEVKSGTLAPSDLIRAGGHAVDLSRQDWRLLHQRANIPIRDLARFGQWCRANRARVDVRCYSPDRDIVEDFVGAVGASLDDDFLRPRFRSNASLTLDAVHAMKAAPEPPNHPAHRRLADSLLGLRAEGGLSEFLHPSTCAVLERATALWCRAVADRYPGCRAIGARGRRSDCSLDADRQAVATRYLREIRRFPTLLPEDQPKGRELFERLDLSTGWHPFAAGATMAGPLSRIRCRVHEGHLGAYGTKVWLQFVTDSDRFPPSFECRVNGAPVGVGADNSIMVDRALLDHRLTLDIELHHRGPDSFSPRPFTMRALEWGVIDDR